MKLSAIFFALVCLFSVYSLLKGAKKLFITEPFKLCTFKLDIKIIAQKYLFKMQQVFFHIFLTRSVIWVITRNDPETDNPLYPARNNEFFQRHVASEFLMNTRRKKEEKHIQKTGHN